MEREKTQLSQRELAGRIGVPQATVVQLEKSRGSNLETLIKVCLAMDVGLDEVVS